LGIFLISEKVTAFEGEISSMALDSNEGLTDVEESGSAVTLQTCIWEAPGYNFGPKTKDLYAL
jgi:hypothetical protein